MVVLWVVLLLGSDTAGAKTLSIFQVLKAVHHGAPLIPGIFVLVRYLSYSSFIFLSLRLYTAKRVGIGSPSSFRIVSHRFLVLGSKNSDRDPFLERPENFAENEIRKEEKKG